MLIGIIILIVAVALAGVLFKNNMTKKKEEEERLRLIAEEEERQRQIRLEEEARKAARKAEIEAGKEIYHYLNQSIKTMFYHYRTEQWDQLNSLGAIELTDREASRRCVDKMSADNKQMVTAFFDCIDFDSLFQGQGDVIRKDALKEVFESMMLPFFLVYYKEFSNGPRYVSFLNQQILKVFTQLSGKKFRLGYKNRYQNGQTAFAWNDDEYTVYSAEGEKLCEASFENGRVKDGFAILKDDTNTDADWDIFQKGQWKNGDLIREDKRYHYRRSVQ